MERTVGAAIGGTGAVLVLEGPAGIGKTVVLEAARRSATEKGALVLSARASELDRGFGFGLVHQLFDRVASEQRLTGAAAHAAVVLDPASGPSEDAGFAVLHGLYWLVANLADARPGGPAGRRPALGRRPVAALPRVPRAPARRAGRRARGHDPRARAGRADGAARRAARRAVDARRAARPARARGGRGDARRRCRRTWSRRRSTPPAATRCCCRSSPARRRARAPSTGWPSSRRAASHRPSSGGCGHWARTRSRWRARSRCWGSVPPPTTSPRSRACPWTPPRTRSTGSPPPRSSPDAPSSTRSCARRCSTPARRASARRCTAPPRVRLRERGLRPAAVAAALAGGGARG